MARIRKTELVGITSQLLEVNNKIDSDGRMIEGLGLEDCQQLAINMGNYIEQHYTDYECKNAADLVVHRLEDYCEFIYQMSLNENLQDVTKLHKLAKKIRAILLSVQNTIIYDLPKDRKQIVFLPYKASMWDSLESIYFASKADESVDTFVIPIPYCDRNPDGTVGEWHYEASEFPEYVPVVDWQKYSIPDEKPDAIFIHNPYDSGNFVTSIHPQYYSSELKKYTDCLVYVPYYVLGKVNPKDPGAIAGMAHMVTTAGVVNSDLVFVQDEDMATIFINVLLQFFSESNIKADEAKLRDKIFGFGSPKYDRVLQMDESNTPIPEAWEDLIREKAPKFIIFVNTSVGALLRATSDGYFRTLRTFFEFCREHDYLPVWRPHPLTESTLRSMRPWLIGDYNEILEMFQTERIGILDLTPSMYPAIRISDMYYGDASSLEWVYCATGKPVIRRGENGGDSFSVDNVEPDKPIEDEYMEIERLASQKHGNINKTAINTSQKPAGQRIYDLVKSRIMEQ